MLPFTAQLVGRFAYAQKALWSVPAFNISLSISGLRHLRYHGVNLRQPGPCMSMSTKGMVVDFEYGPDRENWVLLGEIAGVRASEQPGTMEIADQDLWITVPAVLSLRQEQVPALQEEFLRLHDAFRNPIAANRLRLQLGLAALIRPFLDQRRSQATPPAERLRRLIEDDRTCRETIGSLSRRCGLHPDHLRERFTAAYGLTPMAYRNRCRMSLIMDLIASTKMTAGEISRQAGFPHATHFSGFVRAATGMSPRQAIARYRYGP